MRFLDVVMGVSIGIILCVALRYMRHNDDEFDVFDVSIIIIKNPNLYKIAYNPRTLRISNDDLIESLGYISDRLRLQKEKEGESHD